MPRLTHTRKSRPTLLPTAAFDLFDRGAVRDALRDSAQAPEATEQRLEMLDVLDALGGEAMNTLHLAPSELALAIDHDLHTSPGWLASALFDAMDRTRGVA